jgi:hypothetical protein
VSDVRNDRSWCVPRQEPFLPMKSAAAQQFH